MSDYVYDNGPIPETKHNPNPAPPDTTGFIAAADVNLLGGNENSLRSAILAGNYHGVTNGATLAAPAAGKTFTGSKNGWQQISENGRGYRRTNTKYDVHAYGIAADNTGDMGAALAAAAAAASSGGPGGVVFIPAGVYTATTAVGLWPVGVSLEGEGRDISKVYVSALGSSTDFITFGAIGTLFSESGGFIKNLTIAAPNSGDCRDVTRFINWNSMEMANCQFYGGDRYAGNMYSVQNIKASHCQWASAYSGGLLIDGGSPEGVSTTNRFYACSFQDTQHGPGVDFRRAITTSFVDCQFTSNGFAHSDTAGNGILIGTSADASHGSHPIILGGHFEANYGYDIATNITGGVTTVYWTVLDPLINAINDKSGSSNGMVHVDGLSGGDWEGGTFNDLVGPGACRFRIGANTKSPAFHALPSIPGTLIEYDPGGVNDIRQYPGVITFFNSDTLKETVVGAFELQPLTIRMIKGQKIILDDNTGKAYILADASTDALQFFSEVANGSDAVEIHAPNLTSSGKAFKVVTGNGEVLSINIWGQLTADGGIQTSPGNSAYCDRYHQLTGTQPGWYTGTGSPQSVVTAVQGSYYTDQNGGAGATLYVKESGTGNTGWVAK